MPELVWTDRTTRSEVRKAMQMVTEQQAMLLSRREDIHGRIE
jgi:hypothetical protein